MEDKPKRKYAKQDKVTTTPEFHMLVEDYQTINNISSWSQALVELAAIGYRHVTGKAPPNPNRKWGGKRDIEVVMKEADLLTNGGQNDPTEADE